MDDSIELLRRNNSTQLYNPQTEKDVEPIKIYPSVTVKLDNLDILPSFFNEKIKKIKKQLPSGANAFEIGVGKSIGTLGIEFFGERNDPVYNHSVIPYRI